MDEKTMEAAALELIFQMTLPAGLTGEQVTAARSQAREFYELGRKVGHVEGHDCAEREQVEAWADWDIPSEVPVTC